MIYDLKVNKKYIRRETNLARLSFRQVKKSVMIDSELYHEKPDWFIVDNFVHYFKRREDCRIIGELLSRDVITKVGNSFGIATADYKPAILQHRGYESLGLLSPNIQSSKFAYCDLANFHNLFYDFPRRYGSFTIKVLLEKLCMYGIDNYDAVKDQIIATYVIDWFTQQLDRNPRNLLFEYPFNDTDQLDKVPSPHLAKLIDSESSFGITKDGYIDSEYPRLWIPAIPYSDVDFKNNPTQFEDVDLNMAELMIDYPEEVSRVLNVLCESDFDSIIKMYAPSRDAGIYVSDDCVSFLMSFVDSKKEEAEKIKRL